jgi:peptidoglycan/xylan/chitin deacetylase (PgdA/CDA1 family)
MIRKVLRRLNRTVRVLRWSRAPVILMYHRVSDISIDPWDMAVHPLRFAEQIDALKRTRRVVHLKDLAQAEAGRLSCDKPIAAVTFDDGYSDVYRNARNILHRHDCPMTLFVTTGAIDSEREFWWDALTRVFLETSTLPEDLTVTVATKTLQWRVPPADDRIGRNKIYREVWACLRELPHEIQDQCISKIAHWAGCDIIARQEHRPMTREEMQGISDELISIGAHTVNHPALSSHSFEAQYREIAGSRTACEALSGCLVDTFAYPFGDYDDRTILAVRRAGFKYAYTSHGDVVRPGADPMRLPRVHVANWDGDVFLRKLVSGSWL